MKGIADTGFLVAFANRNDCYHEWAKAVAQQATEPFLTCEAVLAEAAFHLNDVSIVFEMIREGLIVLLFNANEHLPQLASLAKRYSDRKPDFADICLIRMSELFQTYPIITVDVEDFTVYRKNKREIIPIISPNRSS